MFSIIRICKSFKKQHNPGFINKSKNPARTEIRVLQDRSSWEPLVSGITVA